MKNTTDIIKSPSQTLARIADDAIMWRHLSYRGGKALGPGQYIEQRVSAEDREILKQLRSEDIKIPNQQLLVIAGDDLNCQVCRFRYDSQGVRRCTHDFSCPWWDHWRQPGPNRDRKRSSVYCFGTKKQES